MLVEGQWLVTGWDQSRGEVAHEDRRAPAISTKAADGADDAVIDDFGRDVHQSRRPHQRRSRPEIAEAADGEVVVDVDVLQDVRLAVDDQALERVPRLGVGGEERLAGGGAADEFVE